MQAFETAMARFGRLHILHDNAGGSSPQRTSHGVRSRASAPGFTASERVKAQLPPQLQVNNELRGI
jgi:NAD(P)-dependent dehydrogenase (short-subunit alcohol dehydrogenase family)